MLEHIYSPVLSPKIHKNYIFRESVSKLATKNFLLGHDVEDH